MHFDKKLGLALGVLLVGVVAAFFFRNDSNTTDGLPRLEKPEILEDRISDKPFIPYLTGVEAAEDANQQWRPIESQPAVPHWEIPEFLKDGGAGAPVDRLANTPFGPPDPIPFDGASRPSESKIPVPAHNRSWKAEPNRSSAAVRPTSERVLVHRVQPGETLSGLAARYLGDARRFNELFDANRTVLRSPHDLRPGMTIKVPQEHRPDMGTSRVLLKSSGQDEQQKTGGSARIDSMGGVPARNTSASPTQPTAQRAADTASSEDEPDKSAENAQRKFVPFPYSPFAPRRTGSKPSQSDSLLSKKRTLSQRPPADLPPLGEAIDDRSSKDGVISSDQPNSEAAKSDSARTEMRTYTVRRGDSLEQIALHFFGTSAAADRIFEANRERLRNPNLLREGMTIVVPR